MTPDVSPTATWGELCAGLVSLSPLMGQLTPAERLVATYVMAGCSNKEVALALGKSEATVKHQIASIFGKLGISTRARLIAALHRSERACLIR